MNSTDTDNQRRSTKTSTSTGLATTGGRTIGSLDATGWRTSVRKPIFNISAIKKDYLNPVLHHGRACLADKLGTLFAQSNEPKVSLADGFIRARTGGLATSPRPWHAAHTCARPFHAKIREPSRAGRDQHSKLSDVRAR
jgi:hypothetical protein